MKTILVILAIIGAIAAFTIPQAKLERREMPSGILHGTNASLTDNSFLASVSWNIEGWSLLIGSGVILTPEWILTSGLTVSNVLSAKVTIRVGSLSADEGGQVVNVSKIIIHPGYNQSTLENDVALVKLSENLTLSEKVTLAPLTVLQPQVNKTAVVAGFGLECSSNNVDVTLGLLRSVNVTIDGVDKRDNNNTRVIRTRDTWNGGPTVVDWGSPLIVDGEVVGLYIGNLTVPHKCSSRNSTSTDNFVDLTQPKLVGWITETVL